MKTSVRKAIAKRIASETFNIEHLEVRNSDDLDFHDIHVGLLLRALEEAYAAGEAAGLRAKK